MGFQRNPPVARTYTLSGAISCSLAARVGDSTTSSVYSETESLKRGEIANNGFPGTSFFLCLIPSDRHNRSDAVVRAQSPVETLFWYQHQIQRSVQQYGEHSSRVFPQSTGLSCYRHFHHQA